MKADIRVTQENGFSLIELLVSLAILVPLMGAVVTLFSDGVNQHSAEQSSSAMNQEARCGLEMMTLEVAQAGSHRDASTTTTSAITASASTQSPSLASSSGFTVGDYVDIDTGTNKETVQVTAVGSNSISAIFRTAHASGVPVRLFALPYLTGVIPPAGLGANSSATTTRLKFFGDVNADGTLYYLEYDYDSANAQITRSMTPITQGSKNAAQPLVGNIKPNSVQFTLYTDSQSVVTSVSLTLTALNTVKSGSQYQETALSSRTVIPSAVAASTLFSEIQQYGGVNRLPPTPSHVTTWSSQ